MHDGTKASRYERFARIPSLETALAYEVIFGVPVRELFAGVYERAERATARRVRLFSKKIRPERTCRLRILDEVAPDHD